MRAVARALFGGPEATEELIADLRAQGASEATAKAQAASLREISDLRLPARMRPFVDLLLSVAGQWRMAGGGMAAMRPVAFDLVAVDVAARWLGITRDAALMRDLQTVEHEALRAMRDKP